jgi:hypothetical protein
VKAARVRVKATFDMWVLLVCWGRGGSLCNDQEATGTHGGTMWGNAQVK